jgi:hypothetical protein
MPSLPAAQVTPIRPDLAPVRPEAAPRVLPLRPSRIEVEPAPVSEASFAAPRPAPVEAAPTPLPQAPVTEATPRRRATTLRLASHLHARLRVARAQLGRSGQSILTEALAEWLTKHEAAE